MVIRRQNLLALVLTLPAGLAIAQSFPPHNMSFMAVLAFAMICLSAMLLGKLLYGAGAGLVIGVVIGCRLTGSADFTAYANASAIFGGLGLVLALTQVMITLAFRKLPSEWLLIIVPFAAVVVERLSWHFFPVSLSLTQHTNLFAMRYIAPITGAWGISWFIWFGGIALALAAWRKSATMLILGVLVLLTCIAGNTPLEETDATEVTVVAVQAVDPYTAAEETAKLPEDVDYVVWTEQIMSAQNDAASKSAAEQKVTLAASFSIKEGSGKPFNSARLYGPDGKMLLETQKEHRFGAEVLTYQKGTAADPVYTQRGVMVGVPICFDMVYPDVARKLCARGARLLLVPNSDPDSPGYIFHRMHLALVAIRAAENRVPIAWAEMTGLSTIFDSRGYPVKQAGIGPQTAIYTRVVPRSQTTLYTRFGDWFVYLCTVAVIAFAVVYGYFRPKHAR